MFPGFWYAGQPIGLGIGTVLGEIWKFFVASAAAGGTTILVLKALRLPAITFGSSSALLRTVFVSLLFLVFYLGGVIVLHGGLRPLSDAAGLMRDFLPERRFRRAVPESTDMNTSQEISTWSKGAKRQPELPAVSRHTATEV
jgi:small basic protein